MRKIRGGHRGFAAADRSHPQPGLHLPKLRTWQLVIVFVLLAFVSATLLRLNNLGMIERRQAVIEADRSGDAERTRRALAELQRYVSSHMNTDMDKGVYLEESYRRDRAAALEAAAGASNPNSAVYQQASLECRSRFQGGTASFRNDYVQCVIERVGSLSAAAAGSVKLPNPAAYRHVYASPVWSPDLAGLAVAATLLIGLAIIARLVFFTLSRLLLRRYYRQLSS